MNFIRWYICLVIVCLYPLGADADKPFSRLTEQLVKILHEHPNRGERVKAATLLGRQMAGGDQSSFSALKQAFKGDPVRLVRLTALKALGHAGSCKKLRLILEQAAGAPSKAMASTALEIAGRLKCRLRGKGYPGTGRSMAEPVARKRLVLGMSAYSPPKGTFSWTLMNLSLWIFSYSLADNLVFSVMTGPPVGVATLMPGIKYSFGPENYRLAIQAQAGIFVPFISGGTEYMGWLAGGGAIASLGGRDHFFNIGIHGYAGGSRDDVYGILLPSLGVSFKLSPSVRLVMEGYLPILPALNSPAGYGALLYGIRLVGKRFYGDVTFVYLFFNNFWDVMKFCPVGYPLLSFGYTW